MTNFGYGIGPSERPPAVAIDPEVRTAAGTPVAVRIQVTNQAPEPRTIAITALGVDAAWLPRPVRSNRPLLPGASSIVELTLSPAAGTIPARYPLSLAVQALDPVTEQAAAPTAIAETTLVVDAPGQIEVELQPEDTSGFFRKKLTVILRNTGPVSEAVRLDVHSPEAAEVELAEESVDVPAGATVPVRGKIRIEPRWFGHRSRYTYTVNARGSGAARRAEGSVTARAVLGANSTKAFVLIAVVTLWAGLALVFIPKLSDSIKSNQDKAANKVAQAQAKALQEANSKARAKNSATPSGSVAPSGSASGANGGGSGGSGSGGSGSGGSGSGGSGSGGSGSGSPAGASSIQLNGTVSGQSPQGVTVSMRPTSLVDEAAQGATPVGTADLSHQPIGKIPEGALLASAPSPGTTTQNRSTTTSTDGAWSFAKVTSPGYYLLTFAKPGYQTQRYVVDAATAKAAQPLKVELVPGKGRLSGVIRGPSGAQGAAEITITDGINTLSTSSNSKGDVGAWSVDGLSTPSSYLITASKDGLSTESELVTLDAGGNATVDLTLKTGVASLVGTVRGPNSLGAVVGLGGVRVTAVDGKLTRTATTVTTGTVAGYYVLPDLPAGTYTVTSELDGYLSQSQQVTIRKGQSKATLDSMLTAATATVVGEVQGVVGAEYDDEGRHVGKTGHQAAINGAGLVLKSAANSYKITSGADGAFRINGVAPGTYTLSAQYSGLDTAYTTVTVAAGQTVTAHAFSLELQTVTSDSKITGFVADGSNPSGTLCGADPAACTINFTLRDSDGDPVTVTPASISPPSDTGPTAYTLSNPDKDMPPGLYKLTIKVAAKPGSNVTGYLPATVSVQVPLNGVGAAPQVNLFPASTITGQISYQSNPASTGGTYTNCVWAIPYGYTGATPTTCDPPTTSSCTSSGTQDLAVGTIDATTGSYTISDVCAGYYTMQIVVQNPDFTALNYWSFVSVTQGMSSNWDGVIYRLGHMQFTLSSPDPSSSSNQPRALTNATLGAGSKCTGGTTDIDLSGRKTDSNGTITVTRLQPATYICTFNTDNTSGDPVSATSQPLYVSLDATRSEALTLTASPATYFGRVTTSWTSPAPPVAGVSVLVSGVTSFTGGVADPPQSVNVTTDAKGCFAIVDSQTSLIPAPTGACAGDTDITSCSMKVACPLNPYIAVLPLAVARATFHIDSQLGYQVADKQSVPLDAGGVVSLNLDPDPVDFSGKITGLPTDTDLAGAKITPIAKASGSGNLALGSLADGTLTWSDSLWGTQAVPGSYTITVDEDGYAPWKYTFTCSPSGTCTPSLPLVARGTLSVTGLPNGAKVTVYNGTSTVNSGTVSGSSIDFDGLLPNSSTGAAGAYSVNDHDYQGGAPAYTVGVRASGYTFDTSVSLSCGTDDSASITISPNSTETCSVTLTKSGTIAVGVRGVTSYAKSPVYSALTSATVTATMCADPNATGTSCALATSGNFGPFTGVAGSTDNDMYTTYTITGSSTQQGLDNGAWLVTATNSGYTTKSEVVSITTAGAVTADNLALDITKVASYTVNVDDATGNPVTDAVTVSLVQGSTTVISHSTSTGSYVFSNVYPGVYSVKVQGDTILPSQDDNVTVSATATSHTIYASLGASKLTGKVLGAQGADTSVSAMAGVQVQVGTGTPFAVASGTDGSDMTTTTGADGTFSFSNVPDGTWSVQLSKTGYVTQTPSVTANHLNAPPTVPDTTLTRVTHTVEVTVTPSVSSDDISGSTNVVLNAADSDRSTWSARTPSALPPTGAATSYTWTFSNVPFGCWTFGIDLPSGHHGTVELDTAPPTDNDWSCTTGWTVGTTGNGSTVTAKYTLDEYQPKVKVTATALALDTAPTTIDLKVGNVTGPLYEDTAFPVGTAKSLPIWLASGDSETVFASTDRPGWPSNSGSVSSATTVTIPLTEVGATVTVTVGTFPSDAPSNATVSVSLTAPDGGTATAPAAQSAKSGKSVIFDDVPYGEGWTATATGTYDVTDSGTPPTTTTFTIGGTSDPFDITSATPGPVTITIAKQP